MGKTSALIFDRSLLILPFTATLTMIITILICYLNDISDGQRITQMKTTDDLVFTILFVGMVILFPQILVIIIGRFRSLLEAQSVINRIILYIIHMIVAIPLIGVPIIACIEKGSGRDDWPYDILIGLFMSLFLYCILHTIYVFYLYIRQRNAFQWSKIMGPIWFVVCTVPVIPCTIILRTYNIHLPMYIVFIFPVLYCLGFVYPFWLRAKARNRSSVVLGPLTFLNDPDQETLVDFPI
ncbi:unnamed protein product [Adineta steineri]|uniref:Uncharacterized protein n=2 Tax=Adineta steineri TaxID=433720 RepID=A0A814CKY3_9BILA|nr:unnamed protein product [Adineta steineri]CAF3813518.1 unnamed protein product [Adineta steineri]